MFSVFCTFKYFKFFLRNFKMGGIYIISTHSFYLSNSSSVLLNSSTMLIIITYVWIHTTYTYSLICIRCIHITHTYFAWDSSSSYKNMWNFPIHIVISTGSITSGVLFILTNCRFLELPMSATKKKLPCW